MKSKKSVLISSILQDVSLCSKGALVAQREYEFSHLIIICPKLHTVSRTDHERKFC
jgi:hypothetical protein